MHVRFLDRKNKTVDLRVYDPAGRLVLETANGFKNKHEALAAFESIRFACAMGKVVVEGEMSEVEKP